MTLPDTRFVWSAQAHRSAMMDLNGGLTRKTELLRNSFFYAFNLHSSLRHDSVYGIKKPEPNDSGFLCSGDRTRTCDLRVMSPTSSQLLHPAMYLHCSISIFIRVIRPMSSSAAADSTPQCIFIALFQFLFGLFARRASPPRRTPPRNVSSLLYFNFYSGYSPDELLRRRGLHPAMYLHCFISILCRFFNRGLQR